MRCVAQVWASQGWRICRQQSLAPTETIIVRSFEATGLESRRWRKASHKATTGMTHNYSATHAVPVSLITGFHDPRMVLPRLQVSFRSSFQP